MNPGERQVSPAIEGIRADHINRYKWASSVLNKGSVIDAACGIGYGSQLLAKAGFYVRSIDVDQEAIDYGEKYYSHPNIHRQCLDLNKANLSSDPTILFECIEHVKNPLPILEKCNKLILVSAPNEKVFPYKNHRFHYRHYTKDEFEDLLSQAGYKVAGWYGQEHEYSEVIENVNGRTLIAMAHK